MKKHITPVLVTIERDDKREIDVQTNYDEKFDLWRITAKFKKKEK
jgi:hypothetical protein